MSPVYLIFNHMSIKKTRTSTQELNPLTHWGKLISKSKGTSDFELREDTISIGRKATNLIVINDQALSSNHCIIYKDGDKIMLKDLSTNGTYLNNNKIGQGNEVQLKHNDEIWLLHSSRVAADKALGYTFQTEGQGQSEKKGKQSASKEDLKRKVEQLAFQEDQLKKKTQEQIKKLEEQKKKVKAQKDEMNKTLKEQITCSICLEIMHVPVAVHPCNHHFCGGCLTSLVQSKQQNCAQCRKQITTGQRDATFNVIIQQYLKSHPDEKRSEAEIADLDKNNIFTFDTANIQELIHGKKATKAQKSPVTRARVTSSRAVRGRAIRRRGSDLSAGDSSDDDGSSGRCRECNVTRNGFQCSASQVHVNCHGCGKLMARRDDPALHQCCVLCDQFYCNLYYPPCRPVGDKLMTIDQHGPKSKVLLQNFRGNTFQYNYFNDYLRSKKLTAAQLYEAIAAKYIDGGNFKFIFDRKVMKLAPVVNRQVTVTRDSAVCTMCWPDLWFQLVLKYRIDINSELPPGVSNRVPCYYGINCSTMGHKADHAKKLNHCEYQTKF